MNRILRLAVAGAAVAAFVAACSSDSDTATPTSAPAATSAAGTSAAAPPAGNSAEALITIKDFKYGDPVTVAPGATVTVVNEDSAGHDVVSDDADRFKTPVLGQGERATFTAPTEPGTYKFSCSLHPGSMSGIGTLTVQG